MSESIITSMKVWKSISDIPGVVGTCPIATYSTLSNNYRQLDSDAKKNVIYRSVAEILSRVHARNIVHNHMTPESICISYDQQCHVALQDWSYAIRTNRVEDKQRDMINLYLILLGETGSPPSRLNVRPAKGGIVPSLSQTNNLAAFYYELFTSPPDMDNHSTIPNDIEETIKHNTRQQFHLTRSLQYVPSFRQWEEGTAYVRLLLHSAMEFVYYADNLAETHQDLNMVSMKTSMQLGTLQGEDDTEFENDLKKRKNAVNLAQRLVPILQNQISYVYTHMVDLVCAACAIVLPACSNAPQHRQNKHFRPVDTFVYILAETLEHCDSTPEERDLCQILGITPGRFTADGGKPMSVSKTIRALYEVPDVCSYAGLHGEKAFAHIINGGTLMDDYIPAHRSAYKPPLRIILDIGKKLCNYQTFQGIPRDSIEYEAYQTNPYLSYWYSIATPYSCNTTQKPVPLTHIRNQTHRMTDLLFHVTNVLVKAATKFPMKNTLSERHFQQVYMMVENGSIRIPYGTNVIQLYKDQTDESVSMWVPDTVQGKEKLMDPLTWDFPSQPVRLYLYHEDGSVSISPDVFEYSVIHEHIAEKGFHPIRFESASIAYFDYSAYCQIVSWLDRYTDPEVKYTVDEIRNSAPEIACLLFRNESSDTVKQLPDQNRHPPYLSRATSIRKAIGIL